MQSANGTRFTNTSTVDCKLGECASFFFFFCYIGSKTLLLISCRCSVQHFLGCNNKKR